MDERLKPHLRRSEWFGEGYRWECSDAQHWQFSFAASSAKDAYDAWKLIYGENGYAAKRPEHRQ